MVNQGGVLWRNEISKGFNFLEEGLKMAADWAQVALAVSHYQTVKAILHTILIIRQSRY